MVRPTPSVLLESGDAAHMLRKSPATIRNYANDGKLPVAATTLKGARLFRLEDIEAFRRQQEERRA